MTKRDVYEFIRRVREKAIDSVDDKNKKEIEKEKKKIHKRYLKEIVAINDAVEDLELRLKVMISKIEKDKQFESKDDRYVYTSTFEGCVRRLAKENAIYDVFEDNGIKNIGGLKTAREKSSKERNMVASEYLKLEQKCRELKSAKQCITYLNELGFDTSSIGKKKEVVLDSNINKDMLFVCGDNK